MTTEKQLLYIGSYASADKSGLYAYTYDAASGELTPQSELAGIDAPAFLVLHPNGELLYIVGETSQSAEGVPGSIWAVRRASATRSFEALNSQESGGDHPCHVAMDATTRWLVVSNYSSGTVGVFPIVEDGTVGKLTDLKIHSGSGPNKERQAGAHAHSAIFSPDNRFAIVADLGLDKLLIYSFDAEAGKLNDHGYATAHPGAGPRHMAFHPDDVHLYVANELDNTVTLYTWDATAGTLAEVQTINTLPGPVAESYVSDIHISPDGSRLYVANRIHDSLAIYDIAPDATLTLNTIRPCGGRWPRNFAIAPDGRSVLVANQHSDNLAVLQVGEGAEATGAIVNTITIPSASFVMFA